MITNIKKISILAICKNNKYHPNLEILIRELKDYDITKISLPLTFKKKLIWFVPWLILFPKYKFKLTQAYIYAQSKLKNSRFIIGYSILPEGIQEFSVNRNDVKFEKFLL